MEHQDFFATEDADGVGYGWEWWTTEQCEAQGMIWRGAKQVCFDSLGLRKVQAPWSSDELQRLLEIHKIDTSVWGQDIHKSISDLEKSLWQGECQFMSDGSGLSRIVDVVGIQLFNPKGQVLIEVAEKLANGCVRRSPKLPGGKR